MGGRPVPNEDLVNLPNWLVLKLRIEGEEAIRLDNVELLSYRHDYDIRNALVIRELRFRDRAGRETEPAQPPLREHGPHAPGGDRLDLTPENWSGSVEVVSALDGRVTNRGVARYRQLEGRHLDPQGPRTFGPEVDRAEGATRQSSIYVAEAARTRVFRGDEELDVARTHLPDGGLHPAGPRLRRGAGRPVRVEKLVAFYTSRDRAISEPLRSGGKSAARYPAFAEALAGHAAAWDELWQVCDVRAPARGARPAPAAPPHRTSCRSARGTPPTTTPASRPAASTARPTAATSSGTSSTSIPSSTSGCRRSRASCSCTATGASARPARRRARPATGARCTRGRAAATARRRRQIVHLNPLSGQWEPDLSHNQRHVNAAIFYNVWHYHQATDDLDFLRDYGAEMMLEIARFWASIAHFNPERDRYEIHGVMGPDEFHEKYPGATEGGPAQQRLHERHGRRGSARPAQTVLGLLPESRRDALRARIGLTDEEIDTWRRDEPQDVRARSTATASSASSRATRTSRSSTGTPTAPSTATSSASTGSCAPRATTRPLQARQAGRHGDAVLPLPRRRAAAALRAARLRATRPTRRAGPSTTTTSAPPTARRSASSPTPACSPRIDPESSWERFLVALESDVGDVQGGTTKEGIHLGVMAGTLDLVQRVYLGAEIRDGVLLLRAEADRPARRPVVPDAVPRHADPRHGRGRASSPSSGTGRGLQPADQGRRRRRRPRARSRRAVQVHPRAISRLQVASVSARSISTSCPPPALGGVPRTACGTGQHRLAADIPRGSGRLPLRPGPGPQKVW